MSEQYTDIGRIGRTSKVDTEDEDDESPLVNTPEIRALVVREFKKIEKIEEDIAERRQDIKEAVKRLVAKGLSRRGVQAALGRRKLVVKGGLEQMDRTLTLICGIPALGIQMELFSSEGGEDDAA